MFKKILLATDFSEAAETAKWLTETLAEGGEGLDLTVLTVLDPEQELPEEGVFLPSDQAEAHERKKLRVEREEALVDYCHALKGRGIPAAQEVREGRPAEVIIEFAREWGADVIVIGAVGKSSAREQSLGKTAQDILKRSTVPVLVAAHHT
jgi:nucleotide-binding universal stress UspA family protein